MWQELSIAIRRRFYSLRVKLGLERKSSSHSLELETGRMAGPSVKTDNNSTHEGTRVKPSVKSEDEARTGCAHAWEKVQDRVSTFHSEQFPVEAI